MDSPLSKADLSQIKKAAALANDAAIKCAKGIEAGLDLGEEAERCGHLQRSLQQLLDIYDSTKNWKLPTQSGNGNAPSE